MLDRLKTLVERMSSRADERMHLGEAGFLRQMLRRRRLESVFLFVTSSCNSRCRTCFYTRDEMQGADLTLEQIRRLSETAPPFDKLWLSGGEPFLRQDLAEIVEQFHHRNGIKVINMPSNGLLPDPVEQVVGRLLASCPTMTIHLNLSLDGMSTTHDRVRGVPGGFARTIDTLERLEQRFGDHPRLIRNVATVVTGESEIDELCDLATYLFTRFRLATQFFEAVRGETRDGGLPKPSLEQLETLHRRLMPLYQAMAERLFAQLPVGARQMAILYFVGVIGRLYQLQRENLSGSSPWGMSCTAGQTTFVIDHDGGFRACELRPRIGRLEDYGYDLGAAVRSAALAQEIDAIGGGHRARCFCTHTCWMISSMKFSPRTLLYEVPRAYLAHLRSGEPPFDAREVDRARCPSQASAA